MIMNVSKCLMAMAAVLLLLSCASSLSCRMDDFVAEAESSCKEWTAEDWELSTEKYEKLLEEYSQNYDSYTQEEKDLINKAIGRYNGLLVRQGLENAGSVIKEFGKRLPSLFEGFMSAFENNGSDD